MQGPKRTFKIDFRRHSITLFLVIAVTVQFITLLNFAAKWGSQIINSKGVSSIEKSAVNAWDQSFAEYVLFLRVTIPSNAKVVLPPNFSGAPIDHVGFMQYFLFPREIINCGPDEVDECTLRVSGPDTYILRARDFPPPTLAELSKIYVPFNEEYGVYVPQP